MKKCYLNSEINCKFVKICKGGSKKILEKNVFEKIGEKLTNLNYKNIDLMYFLVKKGYRDGIYDRFFENFGEILLWRKKVKKVFGNGFYYFISYDSFNKFNLLVKKNIDNFNYLKLYPKCCTKAYIKRNGVFGKNDVGFFSLFHELIGKSNFYCPLIKFNLFIEDKTAINSPFFPYYEPCSLDCNNTIIYIGEIFNYINLEYLINEGLFYFLKAPIFIFNDYIFNFNGYYENGIIYYKGVYIRNINLKGKIIYKSKLKLLAIEGNKCIIGGLLKSEINKKIILKNI